MKRHIALLAGTTSFADAIVALVKLIFPFGLAGEDIAEDISYLIKR